MANDTFKKTIGVIIFFLFFSFSSYSQKKNNLKEFPKEFPAYLSDLKKFMTATDNDKLKLTYNKFEKDSENLSELEKNKIIYISNQMLSKRLKSKPYFFEFLAVIVNINNHARGDVLLLDWLEIITQMLEENSSKKVLMFCRFTNKLINQNVLRASKSAKWEVSNTKFYFAFEMYEPVIVFDQPFDLSCSSDHGSYTIFNTKGKYYFLSTEWKGEKGIINWQSYSFHEDSVFSSINKYKIDTRKTEIVADSSIFYNKYILPNAIVGKLINKIAKGKQKSFYPQFTSYAKNIELKDIFDNVDYIGGYKMRGKDFVADGGDYAEANIVFKRNGKEVFIANAKKFSINSNEIASQEAGVKIFFDSDSIYHSNLQFKYIDSKRQLQLYRNVNGLSGAPMFNTYHNVTMDFELLQWNIDTEIITFGSLPGSAESRVEFESIAMYDSTLFLSMQGIDRIHPLLLINNYVKEKKEETFYVEDFARFAKFPLVQIQHLLMQLANNGFIFYDFVEERIIVMPKLFNYVNAASKVGDYDVISFNSNIKPGEYKTGDRFLVNAALNLTTKDLNIIGIDEILVSNNRGVYLFPKDGLVVIKKNRDFIFNGQILAGDGRFNLFGREFYFHYDEFKVDLDNIDSLQLSVPVRSIDKDMYNNEFLTTVKTVIESVRGELRIDDPNNKSGIKKAIFSHFPVFESFDDSYAYYDKESIYNGIYDRDRFSFHLQPFSIDSLDSYTGEGLWFAGTFESAGIFPNFDDTLRLQKDYSLGFNRQTPSDGFSIYGGKARYYNNIHLSHEGLKGEGDLEYLNSKSNAKELFFFPDSTNFYTQSFIINEVSKGIEFPNVKNNDTYVHFEPFKDRMMIYQIDDEFNFYNSLATFSGNLLMRPTGLTGNGIMSIDKAKVNASLFTYNANWFGSDTASLRLYENSGLLAFKANDLKTHIDLLNREGIFYSNGSGSYVELPANQYISYIDKLNWNMDENSLSLGEEFSSGEGSVFISTHSEQDSLKFIAKTAFYSLKDYVIHANGVDSILVADAMIFPDSGIITVAKNAVIQTLYDAKILADNLTQYHTFNNAIVDIKSAHKYFGSGDYIYFDGLNKTQNIFFKEIKVEEKDTVTIAKSNILADNIFHIDSLLDFKGDIYLTADQKNLTFDGYFMINYACSFIEKEWVSFKSIIDPKNINLTLANKIYNDKEDLLSTGLVMSFDSSNFYSTFLSKKKRAAIDLNILPASNNLIYDKSNSTYYVGSLDTLSNYYILYDQTCKTEGHGIIDLNTNLGQFNLQSIGKTFHDINTKETEIEGFLILDFFFSEKAMKVMSEDLYGAPGEETFEYDTNFVQNITRLVGKEKAELLLVDLEIQDEYSKFPEELKYSIVLAKTKLKWDHKNKAYIGKGSFGVSSILDKQVSSIVDGYIVIEKGKKSDVFTLYLETELYDEYYFQYKNGVMQAYSTNPKFMAEINDVKAKKRVLEKTKNTSSYRYNTANEDVTEKFLRYIKKKY